MDSKLIEQLRQTRKMVAENCGEVDYDGPAFEDVLVNPDGLEAAAAGIVDNQRIANLVAEVSRLREALGQADDTLDQILDDMRGDGLCVCKAVKDEAIETLAAVRDALTGEAP